MSGKPTTKQAASTPAKPPLIDDSSVKEAFADDFAGLLGIGPNFHFTFATRRPAKPSSAEIARLVTARLVLPLDTMLELYGNLQKAVASLESRGVIKRREEPAKTK